MPRLIDAEKYKAYLQDKYVMYDHMLADIDAQQTVDAEPVTRCKDCESWGLNAIKKDEKGEVIYGDCLHFCCSTPKWFYCAWGKRKENETANTYSIGKVAIPHEVFEQIYEEGKEDAKTD